VSRGINCLKKALILARWIRDRKPLLCVDHIDRALPYNEKPTWLASNLISSKSLNLADKGIMTLFIASDCASREVMLSMSGVRSRLSCYAFPEEPEKKFIEYLQRNENPFKKLVSSDQDYKRCYDVFDSSLRYVSFWVESGEKLEGMFFGITY